jgi:signal transduction histidine kinase
VRRARRFIWFHLPTVLVVGLLPLVVLSAMWFVWHRDAQEERVRRLQGMLVQTLAATLQGRYQEHARQVEEIARRVGEQKLYRRPAVLQGMLEHAHGLTGGFVLAFHDPTGLGTAISRALPPRDGRALRVNVSQRAWFREVLEKKAPVVTSFVRTFVANAPAMTFASPVLDGDRVVGVITLVMELRVMAEGLEAHAPPRAGHVFLLDRTGAAYHVDPATGKPELADWRNTAFRSALAGPQGVRRFAGSGPEVLVSWATVPAAGVVVGVETPVAEIAAGEDSILAKAVLVATVLLISLSFVTAVVSGKLARRELETLRGYLRGLASASRESPPATPALRVRELAEVAADARAMADAIKLRQGELEVFHALDHVMAGANEPQDVVRLAVRTTLSVLGFDAAAAFILDERPAVLRLFHDEGLGSVVAGELRTLPVGAGPLGRVIQERSPVILPLDARPPIAAQGALDALKSGGFLTVAATPLVAHGRVYGLLSLLSRQRMEPSTPIISLLASVGTEIGVAAAHAAERERLVAQDRLAALGRLAAGTAHELRNPLTVILNRTYLLKEEVLDGQMPRLEDLKSHVASVVDAADRMTGIVEGLLTYARPPKPEPALLDVVDVIGATWQLVEYEAKKRYVDIVIDVAPGVPRIMGDRSQLMQVLLNLATNAIEAMSGGEGRLTLRVRAGTAEAAPVVLVEVIDTGPGIPSAILPRIWEPFFTTKAEGTGLGLSIVRGLVADQPGATIAVATEAGRGTTFTLTFPAVRDA